jgi:hypothetical protein
MALDFQILEKKGLDPIELEVIRNWNEKFTFFNFSSIQDIRFFLIWEYLDVIPWSFDQKEKFILQAYGYREIVLYQDGLVDKIKFDNSPGINTALIPKWVDCFGYLTVHEVLSNLDSLLQPEHESDELLSQSATENWIEFISELGVFHRQTKDVKSIRDQFDLDENSYPFLGDDE